MPTTPARSSLAAAHPFDAKRAQGRLCSCGHERSEHVERYEAGRPLRNVCRACEGP